MTRYDPVNYTMEDKVRKNPGRAWFYREITRPGAYREMRALYKDGDWWVWPSHVFTHFQVAEWIGLPYKGPGAPTEIFFTWADEQSMEMNGYEDPAMIVRSSAAGHPGCAPSFATEMYKVMKAVREGAR